MGASPGPPSPKRAMVFRLTPYPLSQWYFGSPPPLFCYHPLCTAAQVPSTWSIRDRQAIIKQWKKAVDTTLTKLMAEGRAGE